MTIYNPLLKIVKEMRTPLKATALGGGIGLGGYLAGKGIAEGIQEVTGEGEEKKGGINLNALLLLAIILGGIYFILKWRSRND